MPGMKREERDHSKETKEAQRMKRGKEANKRFTFTLRKMKERCSASRASREVYINIEKEK